MTRVQNISRISLPENFQDVLVSYEMSYARGDRTLNLIKKLIYLYSLGTEYYDSVNNRALMEYYSSKTQNLLMNSEVLAIFDTEKDSNSIELCDEEIKVLFENKLYKKFQITKEVCTVLDSEYCEKLTTSVSFSEEKNERKLKLTESPFKSRRTRKSTTWNFQVNLNLHDEKENDILLDYYNNQSKINNLVFRDLKNQSNFFENRKNQKQLKKQLIKMKIKKPFIKRSKEVLKAAENANKKEIITILNNIMDLSEKKCKIEDLMMNDKIENILKKNISMMKNSIEDSKAEIEEEIRLMTESGYYSIAEKLRDEMSNEIDNIKEHFSELRIKEIDLIKRDYRRHNTLC